jgi:hypothetical protein
MSYDVLRNFLLPVTAAARQNAARQGITIIGFRLIRDRILRLGHGAQAVRETFDYTDAAGESDTFDMEVVTDPGHTVVLFLFIHCTTTCYSKNQAEIEHVLSSLTVYGFLPD